MDSPEHRKYLLKRRFRDLGVAAIAGTPYDPAQADGVTVATERASGNHDADRGERGAGGRAFRTLQGVRLPRLDAAWPRDTPWLYFGFAVPDRTGGQIKESAARSRYGLGPR